jgi:REP element-mobilizing transposase RayT
MAPGIFHVFTHCVWAAPAFFRDDTDRMTWLRLLARTTRKVEWKCIAFVLMPTHHHLILEVGPGVMPRGMFRLNLAYARYFNQRHGLRGHVQFRRYGARRIRDESQLLTCFKYVARNPADAGLCESPCDWQWSSYPGTVGLAEAHSFVDASLVLAAFAGSRERAIAQLRRLVEEP